MNEDEFAERLANIITTFIQSRFDQDVDFHDNPYHHGRDIKADRIELLKEYAKHKRYVHGIQQILENDLFELEKEDLPSLSSSILYNYIQAVYEELIALSTENNDEEEVRKRCCY